MPIPNSNLRFSDLRNEFGGSNPVSLSQYYRGGSLVPIGTATSPIDGVPISTAGAIRLGMFRGVSAVTNINLTISANTANYNLRVAAGSPGGPANVTLTIDSNVVVYSNSASTPALDTGTGWAVGSTLTIINNGYIIGGGGDIGLIDNSGAGVNGDAPNGQAGGTAFRAQYGPVLFTNNRVVAGGGGQGGYGGNGSVVGGANGYGARGGAGRGGLASAPVAAGGSNIFSTSGGMGGGGAAGGIGNRSLSEGGGGANASVAGRSGGGGSGGGWGCRGQSGGRGHNGTTLQSLGGTGAAAGKFVDGGSNVTWVVRGLRYGLEDTNPWSGFGGLLYAGIGTTAQATVLMTVFSSTIEAIATGGTFSADPGAPMQLYSPGASVPANWVRFTVLSGPTPTGVAMGVWHATTVGRQLSLSTTGSTPINRISVLLVEFATDAGGSSIVNYAQVTLQARRLIL